MSDQYQDALRAKSELTQTQAAFHRLAQDLLKQIGETAPAETEKRESLYHQFAALKQVEQSLLTQAAHADIEERRNSLAEAGFSR